MRLWPKRRAEAPATSTPDEEIPVVRSPETQRALEAARAAAVDLHEARRLRAKIDRRADQIEAETSKNGFVPLIRQAFGSGS
jgi:hypothetical protein